MAIVMLAAAACRSERRHSSTVVPSIRLPGGGQLHGGDRGTEREAERLRLAAAAAAARGDWTRAQRLLDDAARHGARPAIVASDRAAIALAASVAGADPLGLVTALAASDEAIRAAPGDATAWRNRALALERSELAFSAREAWTRYLALVGPGAARSEGQRGLLRLIAVYGPGSCWEQPTRWRRWLADPRLEEEPTIVGENVQALRLFLEDELLPAWGEAQLHGPRNRAIALAAAATRIAGRVSAAGGDPLSEEMTSRALARGAQGAGAVLAYGRGRSNLRSLRYEEAARALAEAKRSFEAERNPGALRARAYRAACLARLRRAGEAEAELRRLHQAPYASVRAYAADQLGSLHDRRGEPVAALRLYREAAAVMAAQHELAGLAVVHAAIADALYSLGQSEEAWQATESALRAGSRCCNAYARGTAVWWAGDLLLRAGACAAAAAPQRESLAIERAAGDPALVVASLQTIALNAVRLGRSDDALAMVGEARGLLGKMASASVQQTQMGFLDWIEGTAIGERDPGRAAVLLAQAMPALQRAGRQYERAAAQLTRGRALLRLGDREAGRAELRRGIQAHERLREEVSAVVDPARAFAEAEPSFDSLTASLLADGLGEEALAASEQGRRPWQVAAAAAEVGGRTAGATTGVLYLDQMDEQLAVWWMRDGHLQHWQLPWSREDGRRRVEALLTTPAREGELARQLAAELLAPAVDDLAAADRVVVVAEDAWTMVPWSATPHPRGGRWIDHLAVTIAPSLAVALRERGGTPEAALVVADAERDPRDPLRLPPLRWARQEGTDVAAVYPLRTLLLDSRASRTEVLASWQSVDVLHFAVHAVVDEAMPGAARLVLSTSGDGGNLTLADVAAARFPRRPLVVLSACFTRAGRLVPLAGPLDLAREFLRSGASGVVTTLRPVDDRGAAALMIGFHGEYVRDGDGPAALARAIRSQRASRRGRKPLSDWPAFQYVGTEPHARDALPPRLAWLMKDGRRL